MTKPPLIAVTSNFSSAKNEYYLLAPYVEAVSKAGGQPVMLPYCFDGDLVQYASRFDGVVFTGGTDFSPDYYGGQHHSEISEVLSNRDGFEFEFAKAVLKSGIPVLGICRGMQLINVLRGGTIFDHTLDQRPTSFDHRNGSQLGDAVHQVELLDGSNLRRICDVDSLWVNSVHHQAVDILGSGLHATALANDGIIEAFEDREYPFLMGIQWHPEHLPQDRRQGRIFDAFITASCDDASPR